MAHQIDAVNGLGRLTLAFDAGAFASRPLAEQASECSVPC